MIDCFEGDYHFLSNFYPSPITYKGLDYPTVEHAFQAQKTGSWRKRFEIRAAPSPGVAKRIGHNMPLRKDWERVKEVVMLDLLRLKFQNRALGVKLILTGNVQLIEGNWWGDRYWGVCEGEGENRLGVLLMWVRRELRNRISV